MICIWKLISILKDYSHDCHQPHHRGGELFNEIKGLPRDKI